MAQQAYRSECRGVSIEIARSGTSILISKQSASGAEGTSAQDDIPRRIVRDEEYPYFADLRLVNGDWVTVEIHRYRRDELPDDFDDDMQISSAATTTATTSLKSRDAESPSPSFRRCSLLDFGE